MSLNISLERGSRGALILAMAWAMFAAGSLPLEAQNTSIAGTLKNTAGEPIAGALVKVRSESLGLGFLVVSQEQGRYVTPNLLPGKYTVQSFGAGYESVPGGPLEVSAGQQGKMDLVLSAPLQIPPREKRMTDDDFEKLMPQGEDGGVVKHSIAHICAECHSLQWIISARKTPQKWQETVDRMRDKLLGLRRAVFINYTEDEVLDGLMKTYLAKSFGPDVPQDPRILGQGFPPPAGPSHLNRNLPGTLLKGAAAKYVAMEFSLPPGSMPNDIAVDGQGVVWVSEKNTGMLGRFDPTSLTYTRIASPPGNDSKFQLNAVAVDPEGQVWYADDGPNARILQYNPKSREFNSYPIPGYRWLVTDGDWARIGAIGFSNGNVWATGLTSDRILRLDPGTKKMTYYPVPKGSQPFGLAIGGNNIIWYSAEVGNVVVSLDPVTGKLTPYSVPTPRADLKGLAASADGSFWATGMEVGKLVKVDREGKVTEFTPPTQESGPFAITVDSKRNLIWFSEIFADKIARFDPSSNTFVEFPHPSADSDVRRIEIDPNRPNRVWWSGATADKIGYIEVAE